jgi:hypothetical protein
VGFIPSAGRQCSFSPRYTMLPSQGNREHGYYPRHDERLFQNH